MAQNDARHQHDACGYGGGPLALDVDVPHLVPEHVLALLQHLQAFAKGSLSRG
jgi:hypothetical protein